MKTEHTHLVLSESSAILLTLLVVSILRLAAANEVPSAYAIFERGPDHRVWKRERIVTNESGFRTNVAAYTELASGLNYWDGANWQESPDEIEIVRDGAAATRGQHTVHWNANLNTFGSITLTMADGQVMRSHPLSLVFYDAATGQSVMLAQLQNSDGILLPANEVIYPGAFGSLADVQYTCTKGGFEQDILIRRNLHSPADYGLNPDNTRLEVWTEFVDAPEPVRQERILPNGFVDESLSFGPMRMGRGTAFLLGGANERMAGTRVSKTWVRTAENRTFLIEAVPYRGIEADLATLPPPQAALGKPEKNARVALLKSSPRPMTAQEARPMRVAAKIDFDRTKALVLDYVTMNVSTNALTFKGDTTYYVSSAFAVTNLLTIEGGAVVKYASGAYIQVYGAIDCLTAPYNPAVFTAKDDHTIGEAVSTNSLSGHYANPCFLLDSTATLHDVWFSHAAFGVIVGYDTTIKNAQFTFCQAPIQLSLCNLTLDNVLFYKGTNVFHGGADATVTARHLTMHQYDQLVYAPDATFAIKLTNSLLVNVTNWGTTGYSTNGVFKVASGSVFQTVGAGAHYLATNSPYRDAGITNSPASLATDLRKKTTYPPLVIDPPGNYYGVSQTLVPRAHRDADLPDLGFHYDPIDYAFSRTYLTNATIQVSPGTTVAFFNPSNASWYGLALADGARFYCDGRADAKVNLTHYSTAQEMANTNWAGPIYSLVMTWNDFTIAPELRCRVTDISVPGRDMPTVYGYAPSVTWYFADCQFNGGTIVDWGGPAAVFTNCLFNRVYTSIVLDDASTNRFHNCTYYGGKWETYWGANNVVSFTDNLFAGTDIEAWADITSSHIGYTTNCVNRLITTNLNDVTVNSLTFQTGPLGRFYLPTI